jgi:hypothetical protein
LRGTEFTALVVDDEKARDVGKDVIKGPRIGGVGRQTGLWLQNHADRPDCAKSAVAARRRELHRVIDAGELRCKHVGFEAARVEKVVLKQLTRLVGFRENLQRQVRMRAIRELDQPILKRLGQFCDIAARRDGRAILRSIRIGMAGSGRLVGIRRAACQRGGDQRSDCRAWTVPRP